MNVTAAAVGLIAVAGSGSYLYKSASAKANVMPTESEVKSYMTSMSSFLQTPPRDEVFGSERIPTLHNKEVTELEGYSAIEQFARGNKVRSMLVGLDAVKSDQKNESPLNRISNVHAENYFDDHMSGDENYKEWDKMTKVLLSKIELSAKNKKDFASYPVDGKPSARMYTLAVKASEKSCYKCHADKVDKPIGHLAVVVEKI